MHRIFQEVYALTEPFEIGADDYLGFWAKEASRLPVPFGFDGNDLSYTFYLSDERFTDPAGSIVYCRDILSSLQYYRDKSRIMYMNVHLLLHRYI